MASVHLGQPGQHLSAQVQQFTTGKNVTLVPNSRCMNSCRQNFLKITVRKLHVFKNCSLEISNFNKNGVRYG